MTTKEFIEKAIEGGWRTPTIQDDDEIPAAIRFYMSFPHRVLLDPEAWKAVGNVEGWKDEYVVCYLSRHEEEYVGSTDRLQPAWRTKWHEMIDALAEEKSIEEFLATL